MNKKPEPALRQRLLAVAVAPWRFPFLVSAVLGGLDRSPCCGRPGGACAARPLDRGLGEAIACAFRTAAAPRSFAAIGWLRDSSEARLRRSRCGRDTATPGTLAGRKQLIGTLPARLTEEMQSA